MAEGAKDIAPQARCSSRRSLDYQCLCDCHLSESTKTVPAIAHSYESHKNDIGTVSDTNNLTLNYRFTKSNEDNQLFNYAEAGGNHFKKKGGSFNRPRPTKMRHCGCCSHKVIAYVRPFIHCEAFNFYTQLSLFLKHKCRFVHGLIRFKWQ